MLPAILPDYAGGGLVNLLASIVESRGGQPRHAAAAALPPSELAGHTNVVLLIIDGLGDKPEPRVEIGGSVRDDCVEYYVRDNGVGIEETQLGRIFQLYHRAPEQTVAGVVQQGHGIGLAVVKRIVQRYGGRISVESTKGVGTTFRITFPRGDDALALPEEEQRPSA